MDERIETLVTLEDCERLEKKIREEYEELLRQIRRRTVELRAKSHEPRDPVEKEALRAVYAYEEVLTKRHGGRRTRASRTWQMIKRHGIIGAVERAVNRRDETVGYTALVELGLHEYTFESIIIRHPERFSEAAIRRSKERIKKWAEKHEESS